MEKFILDFGNISFDSTLKLSDYSFTSSIDNRSTNSSNNSKEAASRNHQCVPSEDEDDGPILAKYLNAKSYRPRSIEKPTRYNNTSDDDDNQVLGLRLSKIKQQQQQQRRRGNMKRNSLYATPPLVSLNTPEKAEPKRMSISGMDLLKQLEQRKADAKRQKKPKIDPSQAKIQGLLSRLPEPGLHTISFQQTNFQKSSPTRKYRT